MTPGKERESRARGSDGKRGAERERRANTLTHTHTHTYTTHTHTQSQALTDALKSASFPESLVTNDCVFIPCIRQAFAAAAVVLHALVAETGMHACRSVSRRSLSPASWPTVEAEAAAAVAWRSRQRPLLGSRQHFSISLTLSPHSHPSSACDQVTRYQVSLAANTDDFPTTTTRASAC